MKKSMDIKHLFFALSTLLLSLNASAVLLYEQSPLDGANSWPSFRESDTLADDFVLSANASLTDITWWGVFEDDTLGNDFNINIHGDDAGLPGVPPLASYSSQTATRTATGLVDLFGDAVYQFDLMLPSPLALMGATTYYLSIEFDVNAPFFWLLSNATGTQYFQLFPPSQNAWMADTAGDLAFALNGTRTMGVPEPSVLLLFAIGLVAVGRYKFRRNEMCSRASIRRD